MPNPAVGAGSAAAPSAPSGMGANPFQIATNLYAEKNLQGAQTGLLLTTSAIAGGGSVNAGQYLRALRLMYRTVTAGATGTALTLDGPFGVFTGLDLTNVDGSEILYNMGGPAYYYSEKYFRPWLTDPVHRYDFTIPSATSGGSFTLSLQPEVRFLARVSLQTLTQEVSTVMTIRFWVLVSALMRLTRLSPLFLIWMLGLNPMHKTYRVSQISPCHLG